MSEPNREDKFVQGILAEGISDDVRRASLQSMLAHSARRHQRRRLVRQAGAALALVAFAGLLFLESDPPPQKLATNPIVASMIEARKVEGTQIKILSDEDLFALFPEQSLGVVGTDEDYQLVFLDRQDLDAISVEGANPTGPKP